MRTYKLSHPLERSLEWTDIHYDGVLYNKKWTVFDIHNMTDNLVFIPDGTCFFNAKSVITQGEWTYNGGDTFKLKFEDSLYVLHLVHLDDNLMIFELQDTKQYFILLSQAGLRTINLTSLDGIEYYIKKLKTQIIGEGVKTKRPNEVLSRIMPIVVMGGVYHSFLQNQDDDDKFEKDSDEIVSDEIEDCDETDSELYDDAWRDEEYIDDEYYGENFADNDYYDDVVYENSVYDEQYLDDDYTEDDSF